MKIVFSDLDGTLLANDKSISDTTFAVLNQLAERDIEFVPCSGRPFSGIKTELINLAATHYVVCSNGALVCAVNSDGSCEVLHREEMPKDSLLWLYEQVKDKDIIFDVLADGKSYSELKRFVKMDSFGLDPLALPDMKAMRTPYDATVPELVPSLKHVERVSIYWKDIQDRRDIIELVESRPDLSWVNSMPTNLEISSVSASKGAALMWLCNYLNIPVADSVAFGDGKNDISMLEVAGEGVAMLNAVPEVLEGATHITTLNNDESGVAHYLSNLLSD